MNKVYIKDTINMINNQEGRKYPCSNQIVSKIIYVQQFDNKVEDYLKEINAQPYHIISKNLRRVLIDNEMWTVLSANQQNRGYRAYEAKIDKRIEDYAFQVFIFPQLSSYCHKVEFF